MKSELNKTIYYLLWFLNALFRAGLRYSLGRARRDVLRERMNHRSSPKTPFQTISGSFREKWIQRYKANNPKNQPHVIADPASHTIHSSYKKSVGVMNVRTITLCSLLGNKSVDLPKVDDLQSLNDQN